MRSLVFLALSCAARAAVANVDCSKNNCLRAVIANAFSTRSASADCSSFLRTTVTPVVTATLTDSLVETVTTTTTPVQSATTVDVSIVSIVTTATVTDTSFSTVVTYPVTTTITSISLLPKRDITDVPSLTPTYASVCSAISKYSSACSCIGVSATTITAEASTTTVTVSTSISSTSTEVDTSSTSTVTSSSSTTTFVATSVTVGTTKTATITATRTETAVDTFEVLVGPVDGMYYNRQRSASIEWSSPLGAMSVADCEKACADDYRCRVYSTGIWAPGGGRFCRLNFDEYDSTLLNNWNEYVDLTVARLTEALIATQRPRLRAHASTNIRNPGAPARPASVRSPRMPGTHINACLSCRQRKLRCDRQQPCSNCVARSVNCKQQLLPPVTRGVRKAPNDSDPGTLSGILSRLDRIEAYISTAQKPGTGGRVPASSQTEASTTRDSPLASASKAHASSNRAARSQVPESHNRLGQASANDPFLSHALVHDLSICIAADPQVEQCTDSRQIQLPPKQETLRFFQLYFNYIGVYQRIIYQPQARDLIEHVYYQVAHVSTTTAPRGLALLLAVAATAILLEPLQGGLDAVLPILKARLRITAVYVRSCLDCLEQHRRRMDHTLENVQALIVLQFLITHIEAFSPRHHALLAEAVMVSYSLGLHLVDSTTAKGGLSHGGKDPITQEMKRRVWWYLTAMDWVGSVVEGPFNAVPLIQPKGIASSVPRHINDDDLDKPNIFERPLSEPTDMSYVLRRRQVAEVARLISDMIPRDSNEATCDMILSLDSKLESLIQDLPAFFRLEIADSEEIARIDRSHPFVPMQRLVVNLLVNLIRCRLHFPFLAGHPSKSLHAFSRRVGVKAARQVLSMHRGMDLSENHSSDFMKIQGTVFHMFTGALILATDLCCNQPHGQDREEQSSELAAVCKQLDGIKRHSQSAAKFLETLTQLLIKYGVWPSSTTVSADTDGGASLNVSLPAADDTHIQGLETPFPFGDLWDIFADQSSFLDMLDIL